MAEEMLKHVKIYKEARKVQKRKKQLNDEAIFFNGSENKRVSRKTMEDIQKDFNLVKVPPPEALQLENISDKEFLENESYSDHWIDCLPMYTCLEDSEYSRMIGGELSDLLDYLRKNAFSVKEAKDIIDNLNKSRIMRFDYFLNGMSKLCQIFIEQRIPLEPPRKRVKL